MAFVFRLEDEDGSPADPPSLDSAAPNWRQGDTIPLGRPSVSLMFETTTQIKRRCWSLKTCPNGPLARTLLRAYE